MNLQHAQEAHRKRVQYAAIPKDRLPLGELIFRAFWILTALRLLARLAENM